MAWLKGLAGKAEDFLNQIDQNAAVALQGEKKGSDSKEALLTEVKWDSPQPAVPPSELTRSSTSTWSSAIAAPASMPTVKSSPNLSNLSPIRTPKKQKDEELINFLNGSQAEPSQETQIQVSQLPLQLEANVSIENESYHFTPVKVDTVDVKAQNSYNSESSLSSSRRSSPQEILSSESVPVSVPQVESSSGLENGISNGFNINQMSDIQTENEMLRHELRTLNNEMSLLLQRAKTAERECQNQQYLLSQIQGRADLVNQLEQELVTVKQQAAVFQEKLHSLEVENDKLVQAAADTTGNESYRALEDELNSVTTQHKLEMTKMESRFTKAEEVRAALEQQLSEIRLQLVQRDSNEASLQQQMERARVEAREARDELEQYRLRAQRILQDKEKLISELREEGGHQEGQDETLILELQQLRQERELLREETLQITTRLQAVRDELLEAEKRLETCREQAADTQQKLQESLSEERKKRQAAEEDCKTHSDELRSVRDELSRQRSLLASRVREREAELTRLRTQLTQRPASPTNGELESRLHALTQTLVQKQTTLETVTTEKNALRMQLEKMERKHQEMMAMVQQNQSGLINVSASDDARAQVPSFFVESPFDTGISRRVKRAYSSLDAVSIRTGVFLRRYPLARILVLCYMVLLHLWVMLVLFTYTPQAQ